MPGITLVSTNNDFWALGVRRLSAVLKAAGHQVRTVFIPSRGNTIFNEASGLIDDKSIDAFLSLVQNDNFVGFSTMSLETNKSIAFRLAAAIKLNIDKIAVGVGGFHATAFPDDCLEKEYIDLICRGEGEGVILDLASHFAHGIPHLHDIPGIYFKDSTGQVIRNAVRPLHELLDSHAYFDYSIEGMYILSQGGLRAASVSDYKRAFGRTMRVMLTYGCPYGCAYCQNDILHRLNPKAKRVRSHSPSYAIAMIKHIFSIHPYFDCVDFQDDSFLSLPLSYINEFSALYKQEIGLPFSLVGVIPALIDSNKIDALADAGLCKIKMGIQSGSERILKEYYKRPGTINSTIKGLRKIKQFRKKIIPPSLDFIVGNPGETTEDKIATLENVNAFPRPFFSNLYQLSYFPNTRLTQQLIEEGLIEGNQTKFTYSQITTKDSYIIILQIIGILPQFAGSILVDLYKKYFKNRKSTYNITFKLFYCLSYLLRIMANLTMGQNIYYPYYLATLFHYAHPALVRRLSLAPILSRNREKTNA